MVNAGLTSHASIDAAFTRQEQSARTRTEEDREFASLLGSINNEAARTTDRYYLIWYFVKKYPGKPRWMKHGPSTSKKRRRARDLALANEAGDGPQGSTQPVVEQVRTTRSSQPIVESQQDPSPGKEREQSIELMDETPDEVATMPPFNTTHMDRIFDIFNNTRRLVSELMQDVVGSDARFRRMLQDRISDVDTMNNEMPRYLFDADEIANIGTWLSLNEPVPDTARSPSPPQDGEEEERLIWSDKEFMGGSPKKD
ncbi:hypothetical protein NLI96_g12817 [Meripilus lineatus]|uniref:Uncharacterized protein n=1 Tax=Meripilus lineatus TaxID=2056292 RepID=A0AAD5Y9I7_9APHY|nr:hypothetical protein NLI96_g12817 [Physisporinus lineatus]